MRDCWMVVCNLRPAEETPSAKRRDKRRGRHAYEAVTAVRSFVQIGERSYTQVCAMTAVAIFCCRC